MYVALSSQQNQELFPELMGKEERKENGFCFSVGFTPLFSSYFASSKLLIVLAF